MQTWLDFYTLGAAESLRKFAPGHHVGSDFEAMQLIVCTSIQAMSERAGELSDHDIARVMRYTAMFPFFTGARPRAGIRLTPDLARDFSRAKPPAYDKLPALLRAKTWYLDVPHRTLMLHPDAQIRAIFSDPTEKGDIIISVIITPPGKDEFSGEYVWTLGSNDNMVGMDCLDLDHAYIRQSVEDFVSLTLCYADVIDAQHMSRIPSIPRKNLERMKIVTQRKYLEREQVSVFSMTEFRSPETRFGRSEESREHCWTLNHRIEVRGHFRMQPHGTAHSLRRLQWIDSYQKGQGNVPSPKIAKIKKILE